MEATPGELTALAAKVHQKLADRGETLATAESLTGGLLGAALTSVAGASATYRGGVIAYATDLKDRLLGVPAALLAERGAVDPDVAIAMAEGARERLAADWGLALTGVAGPEQQDGKPVGTVFVGVAFPSGSSAVTLQLSGERDVIRVAACRDALHTIDAQLADGE
jgi:nicotinamide-nucleotide amidase